jgi:transposase-like protein
MYQRHSKEFKESIVQKIMMPGGPTIMQLAEKNGLHHSSIRNWINIYASSSSMKKSKEWTPEKKLQAIAHTLNMNESDLGKFLRANGLHSTQLEEWKQEFYGAHKGAGRPKLDPELTQLRAEKKELTSDLKRKDKALAEMAARIILIKKSHILWGISDEEDE